MSAAIAEAIEAYCFKCRAKRVMLDPVAVYTKTGSPAVSGTCPVCGGKLFKMGRTPAHDSLPKPEIIEKPKRQTKTKPAKKAASQKKSRKKQKSAPRRRGKLVIVESPAKARSIGGFLGGGYTVLSSRGHVRDLLKSRLSVDTENDFEPRYRVPNEKKDTVKELKSAADKATEIYLATDPDREGEAIAWHLVAAADMPSERVKRVVFHEITDSAVAAAFAEPRDINQDLVDAQQARRILDRLVGYNITELLWNKVRGRLSAGRVQSIALRLVVEREKEIAAFTPEEYWSIEALLAPSAGNGKNGEFKARLIKIAGKTPKLDSAEIVQPHASLLEQSLYRVAEVKKGKRQRKPQPPFTTSSLQQEASRRLGFSARRTMQVAQQLYEGIDIGAGKTVGLITYMRTDSVQVAKAAQTDARQHIETSYGESFRPKTPPKYKTRSRGAQEAHEAVRPTSVGRTPQRMQAHLNRDQLRLYRLVWQRFVASQMSNAVFDTIRLDVNAGPGDADMPYLFRATGQSLRFAGFLAVYGDGQGREKPNASGAPQDFPPLSAGQALDLRKLLPEQHFTQPPPRYTEATLIKQLEEYGIGRPSTYAPTVTIIQTRDYVVAENRRLKPTETGVVVSDLLSEYFSDEMDYSFTARMEDQLDAVSEGKSDWRPMLREFYAPFEQRLINARENMPRQLIQEFVGRKCPSCGDGDLLVKYGRFGKFIGCSNYPECRHTEQFLERTNQPCPLCGAEHGGELVQRRSRKGKRRLFYGCSRFPDCEYFSWRLPKRGAKSPDAAEQLAAAEA